jgi:lipoprotein signal peptidase
MTHDHPNPFINLIYIITGATFGIAKPFFHSFTAQINIGSISISAQMLANVIVSTFLAWFVTMILKSFQLWYKRQNWGFSFANITKEQKSTFAGIAIAIVATIAFMQSPPQLDYMGYMALLGLAGGLAGFGDKFKKEV